MYLRNWGQRQVLRHGNQSSSRQDQISVGREEPLEKAKLRENFSHSKIPHIQCSPENARKWNQEVSVIHSLAYSPRERNTTPEEAGKEKRLGGLKLSRNSKYLIQFLSWLEIHIIQWFSEIKTSKGVLSENSCSRAIFYSSCILCSPTFPALL